MKLACTYIEAEKFEETIKFYKKIFNQEPKIYCENRWVEFENQNKLSIFNANYDKENLEKNENAIISYNEEYIKNIEYQNRKRTNNSIILNFFTENLKEQFLELKEANIGEISKIMYVNIVEPYYYFNITDPEGNVLEICGEKF